MVAQELVDRLALLKLGAELGPSDLEDLADGKVEHLLDEVVHPRAEGKHAPLPRLQLGVRRPPAPGGRLEVLGPRVLEDALEVPQPEEVPEDHLVERDGPPREDERQRERERVVEVEHVPPCAPTVDSPVSTPRART